MPNPAKNRFAYLDGLRGMGRPAGCFPPRHHRHRLRSLHRPAIQSPDVAISWLSGTPFSSGLAASGNLAVCIFFALSGFVLPTPT